MACNIIALYSLVVSKHHSLVELLSSNNNNERKYDFQMKTKIYPNLSHHIFEAPKKWHIKWSFPILWMVIQPHLIFATYLTLIFYFTFVCFRLLRIFLVSTVTCLIFYVNSPFNEMLSILEWLIKSLILSLILAILLSSIISTWWACSIRSSIKNLIPLYIF